MIKSMLQCAAGLAIATLLAGCSGEEGQKSDTVANPAPSSGTGTGEAPKASKKVANPASSPSPIVPPAR
jgi:ABC-type glycerol-3-phosphate transport system substrate-binding protein